MLKKKPKKRTTQLTSSEIEEVNTLFQMAAEEEQEIATETNFKEEIRDGKP